MAGASERVYVAVRDRIVRGIYPSASRITEKALTDLTGVSRTPVREALRRLQAEGFVKVVANHSAIVTEWTEEDTNNVFDLRALLEPYGAAQAALSIPPAGIDKLRTLAEDQYMESEVRADGFIARIWEINSVFHQLLHGFSGNPRLNAMLSVLLEAPMVLRALPAYEPTELLRAASHHFEIVCALQARDSEWAAAIMRSHIHAARSGSSRPAAPLSCPSSLQSTVRDAEGKVGVIVRSQSEKRGRPSQIAMGKKSAPV
ncbi:GntR family transcriptional regulator [Povalibacter sp.]|uniref:GntR family transcriptional regulator n=1 Tax=Povalibacter sp. TaxID=1962978 RepID=UPI002F418039